MGRTFLALVVVALSACQAQPVAQTDGPPGTAPEIAAEALADQEIGRLRYDLAEEKKRFLECKERWARRLSDAEILLRLQRRNREILINQRPDLVASGEYAVAELDAEKQRLEMDRSYKTHDTMGCFN